MQTKFYDSEQQLIVDLHDPSSRSKLAPVIVFVYNRSEKLKNCLDALAENYLSVETDLFIISDGPRPADVEKIEKIRMYLSGVSGFRSINVVARQKNLGATKSIISAEQAIGELYGRHIAMEDDNIVSNNFLDFMNQALEYYKDESRVYSICGYKQPFDMPKHYAGDIWFSPWHNPWAYATWFDRVSLVNIEFNDFSRVFSSPAERKRLRNLGLFMFDSAWLDWKGFARANDARICMHMFIRSMISVVPVESLVFNDGHDGHGLHAKKTNRFKVEMSNGQQRLFQFKNFESLNNEVVAAYKGFMDRGMFLKIFRFFGLNRLKYIVRALRMN